MAEFIPEEVLVQILKKVPPKSLMRFTCVCKLWHSIIISSSFITDQLDHTLKAGTNLMYLVSKGYKYNEPCNLWRDDASLSEIALLQYPLRECITGRNWKMVGTVNGLVCLRYSSFSLSQTNSYDYLLWNPSIHKVWPLPRSRDNNGNLQFGFGFDSVNDDYKVVEFTCRYRGHFSGHLFSLRKGSWRALDCRPPSACLLRSAEVYYKGNVHWLGSLSITCTGVIFLFDMVTEEFKELMLPNEISDHKVDQCMTIWRESLCVLDCKGYLEGYDMWVMKEYGMQESWTKQFTVNLESVVVGFRRSGELLMVEDGHLLSYNMETSEIVDFEHEAKYAYKILPYVETLVLADIRPLSKCHCVVCVSTSMKKTQLIDKGQWDLFIY